MRDSSTELAYPHSHSFLSQARTLQLDYARRCSSERLALFTFRSQNLRVTTFARSSRTNLTPSSISTRLEQSSRWSQLQNIISGSLLRHFLPAYNALTRLGDQLFIPMEAARNIKCSAVLKD